MPKVQNYDRVYVVNPVKTAAIGSNVPTNSSPGLPDNSNTTTTPLAGAAIYTGTFVRATADQVSVSCKSDVAGTLYFDFSNDGTNVDTFPVAGFTVAAGVHEYHSARVNGRHFRVRYVNGSGTQSYLRIYTYFGAPGLSSAPMNQAYALDADAVLTRSPEFWLDVSRGLVSGVSVVKKFGRNSLIGTSFVPLALGGIYRTPQIAAATTLRVKAGGNANDTAAGSGAREISITGTGADFAALTQTVATAGASASSATASAFTRVHRVFVSASGTYASATAGSHVAAITIEDLAGTQDWATIGATGFPKSQSEIGAYTIPAGLTGYVFLKNASVDSGKTVDFLFFARQGCDQTAAPYSAMRTQSAVTGVAGGNIQSFAEGRVPYGPYTGPCDVGFLAKVATGTASAAVEFEIYLVS